LIKGAVYGGGVGLAAACDYAIADESAKFCLSEVKIGLIPAIILPYLGQKLKLGDLNRYALTARVFSAQEAKDSGLIQLATSSADFNQACLSEVSQLLAAGPGAQQRFKHLAHDLGAEGFLPSEKTAHAISAARASEEGKHGLAQFFNKAPPQWICKLHDLNALIDL
jgi:methylglutaconyl-CoA hydratase